MFLAHYSTLFTDVEIDSTFYGIPRPEQMQRWTAVTPPHFTFSLKTPKTITHELGLGQGLDLMYEFLEVAALMQEKLAVVLIQFGPNFTVTAMPALDHFLSQLPTELRYAVEFRHPSWEQPETNDMLRKHHVCRVAADYIHMPKLIHRTTDFLYLRFIGPHGQFGSKDRELLDKTESLTMWHDQIKPHLPHVSDVYVYMNNDFSGFSPATCNRFKEIVGIEVQEIRPLQQGRLF
jgi:uncharacterized protein YecE (DUF72 family)